MPITVSCPCLNTYRVKDELAGKRIKCPHCQQPVSVPMGDVESSERVAPLESHDPMSFSDFPQGNPYPQQQIEPYPTNQSPYQSPQPTGHAAANMSALSQIAQNHQATPQRSSGVNGGKVLAGVGMMVGAVVWFFGALFLANRIFIYPPILFVIGLVAFIKGLVGSD